jgi:hypothetical protein
MVGSRTRTISPQAAVPNEGEAMPLAAHARLEVQAVGRHAP